MIKEAAITETKGDIGYFERYLTLWVRLCIATGILLGAFAPQFARTLNCMRIDVNGAPVDSIPIAIYLFFMMYPIMVKIGFAEVVKTVKSIQPVSPSLRESHQSPALGWQRCTVVSAPFASMAF